MTNSLAQQLFDIDLWFVGAAHFVILVASFQVPYRLGWKHDLRQLMPFNRKLLWVLSGFTVLTIIARHTDAGAAHGTAPRRSCGLGACLLYRDVLDYADYRRRTLLFPRGLAEGQGICRGARPPDTSVLCARRQLYRVIRLARVAQGE
jgi:hypothetical protein